MYHADIHHDQLSTVLESLSGTIVAANINIVVTDATSEEAGSEIT